MTRTTVPQQPWDQLSFWRRKLPDNAPLYTGSANYVTDLLAQVNQAPPSYIQDSAGPIYVVDSSTPIQHVRLQTPYDASLAAAFNSVPIMPGAIVGDNSDKAVSFFNPTSGEFWEFWKFDHSLLSPSTRSGALASQITFSSGGTLPVGATIFYIILPLGGDVTFGYGAAAYAGTSPQQSCAANQQASFSWAASEGATRYEIWRAHSGIASGAWQYISQVNAPTTTFTDPGITSPGAPASQATAVMSTPAVQYGGYMPNTYTSTGRYESPHIAWGSTATSLPQLGGLILINESLAKDIPHATTVAIPSVAPTFVWPAQRTDANTNTTNANNPKEGMCFRLPAGYDVSGIANPWTRALARSARDYGIFINNRATPVVHPCEDFRDNTGITDPINQLYGGQQRYQATASFPWSQLQVVDPSFLQTYVPPPPSVRFPSAASITTVSYNATIAPAASGATSRVPVSDAVLASQTVNSTITPANSAAAVTPAPSTDVSF